MIVFRMLLLLCITIFVGEIAVMHMLEHLEIHDETIEAIVDAGTLLALVFPVLYFSILRTMVVNQARLEAGIQERTADIEQAKNALEGTVGKLKSRQEEMILLGEMGSFFQSCQDLDEAMLVAEVELARLFPDISGALFLMNSSHNILEKKAGWGEGNSPDHFSPPDCWALRRSKPHVATKVGHTLACSHDHASDADWRICLPLVAQGEALGTLCIASRDPDSIGGGESAISEERMQFYLAASENLALAIANLRLQEKLSFQALRDPLTGLFNRRYLLETLDRELDRAASLNHPLSLLMFDIDHFKRFNDSHGHAVGDVVLSRIGAHILEWARGKDIPVRYGGEEFTVVLPETSPDEAFVRAESLRREIENLIIEYDGGALGRITISTGIASYPMHGSSRSTVLERADQALYKSKKDGRNRTTLSAVGSFDNAADVMVNTQDYAA